MNRSFQPEETASLAGKPPPAGTGDTTTDALDPDSQTAQLVEILYRQAGEHIRQGAAVAESSVDQHRIAEAASDRQSLLEVAQGGVQLAGFESRFAFGAQILEGSHGRIRRFATLIV